MRKTHLLASAAFAAAAFFASPSPAAAGATFAIADGFEISYRGVFNTWLVGEGADEAAIHLQIGPVPAGFVDPSPWIQLNGPRTDANESFDFRPPYGVIPGASDFFAAKIDNSSGTPELTVGMISDGSTGAENTLFNDTFFNGLSVTTLVETGGWQDVSFNWGLPAGTFRIRSDVPEPASLALLGAALAGLGAIRRRRA